MTAIVPIELPSLPLPRIDVPALPPVPLPVITLGATPLPALPAQALPVPIELPVPLPGFDVLVPGALGAESPPRAGPGPRVLGTTAAPVLLPPWVPAPSFRAGSPYAAAGTDETSARQSDGGAHAVPPAAERPAPPTIPTQRVAGSAAPAAAGGAGAGGAAAVALIFAIFAAYALVPPGGFRRLRRIRVRTLSGVDGARRERPG